ncbi:hypothetical protein B7486_76480, partial [cyanobacterium TDX16]
NDVSTKIDHEVVELAKVVAAYKRIPLAQLLSEILRPIIVQLWEEEHAKTAKAVKASKGKGEKKE